MSAPWVKDLAPERWVSVKQFARIVNRSPVTVYKWLEGGETIKDFGYKAYQDPTGRWFVQVRKQDLEFLRQLSNLSPVSP